MKRRSKKSDDDKIKMSAGEKVAGFLELPKDVGLGLAHIEMIGNREILIDGACGIIGYGDEEVSVNTQKMVVKIKGKGLILKSMTNDELLIEGKILSVELLA